jgi:hypothetical protein
MSCYALPQKRVYMHTYICLCASTNVDACVTLATRHLIGRRMYMCIHHTHAGVSCTHTASHTPARMQRVTHLHAWIGLRALCLQVPSGVAYIHVKKSESLLALHAKLDGHKIVDAKGGEHKYALPQQAHHNTVCMCYARKRAFPRNLGTHENTQVNGHSL